MSIEFLLATVLALLAGAAHSQTDAGARKYAVLSLVGDELSVVTYQPRKRTTGDENVHESLPISDGYFDKAAVLAVDAALQKRSPNTPVVFLKAPSPALYHDQEGLFSGSQLTAPPEIVTALKGSGATHLILLTKYRGEARLTAADRAVGAGKLEGLGFYVDRVTHLRRSDTQEDAVGYLAPYVYVTISLIDVATLEVLSTTTAKTTTTLSAARSKDGDPWNVWTPAEKLQGISRMLQSDVRKAVPALLDDAKKP